MNGLFFLLLRYSYIYGLPVLYVGGIVISILIAADKQKATRFLGVSEIFLSLSGLLNTLISLIIIHVGSDEYYAVSEPIAILTIVFLLSSTVFVCIFIHKNYGYKFIYFLLIPARLGVLFIPRLAIFAINKMNLKIDDYGYWIQVVNMASGFIAGAVLSVILIVIFFKNRKKEKVIPHYWMVELIELVSDLIFNCVYIAGCMATIKAETTAAKFAMREFTDGCNMVSGIAFVLAGLAIPIYILVSAKKSMRKDDIY